MMDFPTSAGKIPGTTDIRTLCDCGAARVITVSSIGYSMWRAGELIQHVLTELFPSDRELLISGQCGRCWNSFYATWVMLGQELEPMQEAM